MRTTSTVTLCTLALLAGMCLAAPPNPPLKGSNLIGDGSFEAEPPGPVSPSDLPEGWFREAYGSAQLSIAADGAPDCGSQSLQMRSQQTDSTGIHSVLIEIDPAKAYLQCGWIKVVRGEQHSGLHLGRAWYTVDESPAARKGDGKNYNYIVTHSNAREWTYYQQVLIPDQTPGDGDYASNEIPPDARYLRVWALAYRWDGTGRFDGLGLYGIDYDKWAREQIEQRLSDADLSAAIEDIRVQLDKIPRDSEIAGSAQDLLSEFTTLKSNLDSEKSRPVSEWIADKERLDGLVEDLKQIRWRLKLTALLQASPPPDE